MAANEKTEARLVALLFDDPYDADDARALVRRMSGQMGLLSLSETAVLTRFADGTLHVSQDTDVTKKDQHIGQIAGMVAAAATGTLPFILAGTMAGRVIGRLTDHGITNQFIKEITHHLQPNSSVLIVLGRSDAIRRARIVETLQQRGLMGKLLESNLPADVLQELDAALGRGDQAA